ncbi:hypothetical protein RJT34_09953 [Clitoria ternatea]|uniref:Uncharacterized protein n=1 Tax=Clitoria ternatea TaxID=43366 RepID=A0AAN9K7I0_CLITE
MSHSELVLPHSFSESSPPPSLHQVPLLSALAAKEPLDNLGINLTRVVVAATVIVVVASSVVGGGAKEEGRICAAVDATERSGRGSEAEVDGGKEEGMDSVKEAMNEKKRKELLSVCVLIGKVKVAV